MEYTTLKVPDLRKLLQERSLPVTGNKADLVSRLQENDKLKAPADDAAAAQPAEDEIDYSDDEVTITTKAAEANSAPAQPETAQPESAPATEDVQVADPVTDEATAPDAAEGDAAPADAAQEGAAASEKFALNLAPSVADEEARKRADRAKRFGVVEDDEAVKKAERAKKFGLDNSDLAKSLDSALPERALKRGRGQNEENGGRKRQDRHDNNRRGRGRHGGGGGGGNGSRAGGARSGGARSGGARAGGVVKTGGSIPQDASEKAKAEARAKRFGTA